MLPDKSPSLKDKIKVSGQTVKEPVKVKTKKAKADSSVKPAEQVESVVSQS